MMYLRTGPLGLQYGRKRKRSKYAYYGISHRMGIMLEEWVLARQLIEHVTRKT